MVELRGVGRGKGVTVDRVLEKHGVPFRTSSGDRGKVHVCCPFCVDAGKGADSKYRLCVHASKGWGKCVRCGWSSRKGPALLLRKLAIKDLATVDRADAETVEEEAVELPPDFRSLGRTGDELHEIARAYARHRGVTHAQMREHEVGASFVGPWAWRVIFPIVVDGKLRRINARAITPAQKPKYLNSKGTKYLFGFDPKAERVVLSEGAIKALRIEQVFDGCSASLLGHDLTALQLEQIQKSACKEILIYPDPETVGFRGAGKIAETLRREWSGSVRLVWPVSLPADEDDLVSMEKKLAEAPDWNWGLSIKLRWK